MRTTDQKRTILSATTSVLLAGGLLVAGCAPKTADPARNGNTAPQDPGRTTSIEPNTTNPSHTSVTPANSDEVIASIGNTRVTRGELQKQLFDAYGFGMLMLLVQRNIAHDVCRTQGLVVSPEDIANEERWTLQTMFPNATEEEDKQKLLEQFLAQPKAPDQMSTRTEFDIIIDTNAHLRKLTQPALKDAITEDAIRQEFDERYGAQRQVRHIMVSNLQEIARVKMELAQGAEFEELVRKYSRHPDKQDGGLLPPFTIKSQRVPESFKRVAFGLKEGEVSDPINTDGSYHLIKLERKIEVKAVKLDDVRDGLREELQEKIVMQGVKELRNRFAKQALAQLEITDPTLKVEFDKRLGARDQLIRDKEKIREEMEKQRAESTTAPSTEPGFGPTPGPSTAPTGAATQPPTPAPAPAAPAPAPAPAPAKPAPATKPAAAAAPAGANTRPAPAPVPTTTKPAPATQP